MSADKQPGQHFGRNVQRVSDGSHLCEECRKQAGAGEGEPTAGNTPCDWCGKGRLRRR